jgi:branched-chain amino acid transport system permease protein
VRVRQFLLIAITSFVAVGALAAPSSAQEPGDDEEATEFVSGTLTDRKGTRERDDDEPVVGAEVIVSTPDGEEVGVAESDEEGRFELGLPGPGAYVAVLDVDTLPDGVGLGEGEETLTVNVLPGQRRPLVYNLGARERSSESKLDRLPQSIFDGVRFGLVIALCAVGLSLIFGTTGLTNFTHGEMVTWGAIIAWYINVRGGMHLIPAAVLAVAIGGLTGAALDRLLWRPLRRRGMSLIAMMIVSIGLSILTRNYFQFLFGETVRPYNNYVIQDGIDFGPIRTTPKALASILICLAVLVLVALFLQYTRLGKATRAVADNPDLAASSGIDVDWVITVVWFLGGALATLGGIVFAVTERVGFSMGFQLLLLMFAGITLGGLGTAYGALVGSFVVGMFIQLSTLFIPTELKNVGALAILIVVLLVRPQGILGRAERIG